MVQSFKYPIAIQLYFWSTQLNAMSLSTSMIQLCVTFEAKLQSTPTSKSYLCIAHPHSVMNYRNRIRLQITTNHILIHFDSFYSILIIIITDSITIEYTSLNGLESNVLPSFLPIIYCVSIHLHGMQSSHIQLIFIQ